MQLPQYYRSFELAWEVNPEDQRRFRRFVVAGLCLILLIGLVLPWVELPKRVAAEEVPPRLARLMQEERPKPPPPKPQPKVEKPKPEPVAQPKPEDTRKKMENSKEMRAIKDELADLRDQVDPSKLRNKLNAAAEKDARSERSLITSKVGTGSAGIVSANTSRGFGSGAGALSDHNTVGVSSNIASNASSNRATRIGNSGKAARSQEEIELVFDKNKGAIYALYTRAMRERADLQGKMVLSLTISPGGDVTECTMLSSELNDPDLEHKIIARVKLFKFEPKDVEPITARKTIEFFPG